MHLNQYFSGFAAHTEAEKIVSDAVASATLRGDAIVKEAEEKATGMIERAEKNIAAQHSAAMADIKGEIGQMAVDIAKKLIEKVKELNKNMGIPEKISGIKKEDVTAMSKYADREGNPLYPVPVLMDRKELEKFYYEVAE